MIEEFFVIKGEHGFWLKENDGRSNWIGYVKSPIYADKYSTAELAEQELKSTIKYKPDMRKLKFTTIKIKVMVTME